MVGYEPDARTTSGSEGSIHQADRDKDIYAHG